MNKFQLKISLIGLIVLTGVVEAALANATVSDIARRTYGSSIHNPDPESLVGQYLRQTGAKSVVRRFLTAPPGTTLPPSQPGPEKLVVAVSAKTWPQFLSLFSTKNYLYHVHYPQQSTLRVAFNGLMGTYAEHRDRFQVGTAWTLLIPILVSDSEGDRLITYFELGKRNYEFAREPWRFIDDQSQPYSPKDGWNNCTSWLGNIPMGDQLVDEYIYASYNDVDGSRPNIQKLRPYTRTKEGALSGEIGDLVRRVWTVPGHQQLAEVLGLRLPNLRGELANPGWMAYTFLGTVSVDRNPVVFVFVQDEQQPLDPNFDSRITPEFFLPISNF